MNYGTIKCRTLRDIRNKIAELNHIEYTSQSCLHENDCYEGTCKTCELELSMLEMEINKKEASGEDVYIEGIYDILDGNNFV